MTMILETFTRVFVDADALDPTCAFYRDLLGGEETMRFAYPQMGLELAAVSSPKLSVLVIAGPPEKRRPFEATRLTIKVEMLEPVLNILEKAGAEQLEPIQPTPVGRKTRFRHADGLIVEYVDHASRA
jgi:glyoxalase/bleomycin resistance protein/dioxygenase superfamily protein